MSFGIRKQAEQFAIEIMETLAGVFPQGNLGVDLVADPSEELFVLTCGEARGIELQVDNRTVMRLEIDYSLSPDRSGKWLKVKSSKFALVPEDSGTPFFRYDFTLWLRQRMFPLRTSMSTHIEMI